MPPARARQRLSHYDQGSSDLGAFGFIAFLAIALFLLVVSVSCQQATERTEAMDLLEAGVATLTEVDLVVAEHRDELRQLVGATDDPTVPIPGYPLDVQLTRNEALNATDDQLRGIILERSALLVYEDGIDAFDRTGSQSIGTLSSEGLLQTLVGQLSETTNQRAEIATWLFLALTAIAAVAVVIRSHDFRRVRNLGVGILCAAIAGLVLVGGVRFLIGQVGGNDPFVEELRRLIDDLAAVPFRNFVVISVLGVFVVLLAPVLQLLARTVPAFGYVPAGARPSFPTGADFRDDDDFDEPAAEFDDEAGWGDFEDDFGAEDFEAEDFEADDFDDDDFEEDDLR
ncbi:MAG: hypothetical protein M0R74_07275 [Dehalococcoidia bacterium]|nr:hypothetical protein [Dehalococcoidia bacterium]